MVAINFNQVKHPHEITGVLRNLTDQAVRQVSQFRRLPGKAPN